MNNNERQARKLTEEEKKETTVDEEAVEETEKCDAANADAGDIEGEEDKTPDTEEANAQPAGEDTEKDSGEADTASRKKERDLGWIKKSKDKAKKAEAEKAEAEKAKLEAAAAEANDKYARLFAEFDNFRKRSEKEKSAMFSMGAKDVIEKILPVLDTLEKGLEGVPEEKKEDPFVVGMEKVHKLFLQNLEGMGVKPIEAVGQEFNPDFHNAVMHVDDENVGENIVVEEFQKGYMYHDSVVRFSMVKVAN